MGGFASMFGAASGGGGGMGDMFSGTGADMNSSFSTQPNGGGMSTGNMMGLMGGGGGIKDLRTKGLESYRDMSRGDLGGLMGMVLGNQAGSRNNMNSNQQQNQRFGSPYQNPYVTGLMGV